MSACGTKPARLWRLLVKLGLCCVVGFVTSLGVAWLIENNQSLVVGERLAALRSERTTAVYDLSVPGYELVAVGNAFYAAGTVQQSSSPRRQQEIVTNRRVRHAIPIVARADPSVPHEHIVYSGIWKKSYGWPALCVCSSSDFGPPGTGGTNHVFIGSISISCGPIWRGLFVNTWVYGSLAGLVVFAAPLLVQGIRGTNRRKQRRCPACGYSLQGLTGQVCPECGGGVC